ncbi:hypothetical protein BH24ACT26_BH24ACT26_20800 [soil metagenome]
MLIAFLLAVAAAVLGIARGGSLEALSATKLRWAWLLAAGLGLATVAGLWAPPWLTGARALLFLILSNLALLVFIAGNRRMPGMLIADVGLALNLLVIVLNGAMPVSTAAARSAGIERSPGSSGLKHEAMSSDTFLPWLGDVVPVPGLREVWSIGDLVLAVGIARLVYAGTTSERQAAATPSRASG